MSNGRWTCRRFVHNGEQSAISREKLFNCTFITLGLISDGYLTLAKMRNLARIECLSVQKKRVTLYFPRSNLALPLLLKEKKTRHSESGSCAGKAGLYGGARQRWVAWRLSLPISPCYPSCGRYTCTPPATWNTRHRLGQACH